MEIIVTTKRILLDELAAKMVGDSFVCWGDIEDIINAAPTATLPVV